MLARPLSVVRLDRTVRSAVHRLAAGGAFVVLTIPETLAGEPVASVQERRRVLQRPRCTGTPGDERHTVSTRRGPPWSRVHQEGACLLYRLARVLWMH